MSVVQGHTEDGAKDESISKDKSSMPTLQTDIQYVDGDSQFFNKSLYEDNTSHTNFNPVSEVPEVEPLQMEAENPHKD